MNPPRRSHGAGGNVASLYAEPKGSQHKPSANIETDGPHHQETNRDKNSGKLRVHLHHAHNARVAIGITVLHVVNCLTGRCGWPKLLISRAQITLGGAPSFARTSRRVGVKMSAQSA